MEQSNLFHEGMTDFSARVCATTLQLLAKWFNDTPKEYIHIKQFIAEYYNQLALLIQEEQDRRHGAITIRPDDGGSNL